jgi:hypothetical protein
MVENGGEGSIAVSLRGDPPEDMATELEVGNLDAYEFIDDSTAIIEGRSLWSVQWICSAA